MKAYSWQAAGGRRPRSPLSSGRPPRLSLTTEAGIDREADLPSWEASEPIVGAHRLITPYGSPVLVSLPEGVTSTDS